MNSPDLLMSISTTLAVALMTMRVVVTKRVSHWSHTLESSSKCARRPTPAGIKKKAIYLSSRSPPKAMCCSFTSPESSKKNNKNIPRRFPGSGKLNVVDNHWPIRDNALIKPI